VRSRPARVRIARVAAPVAFLLAVTIAVLLIRSALRDGEDGGGSSTPPASTAAATSTTETTKRRAARKPPRRFYVIREGDTFGTVADRFDTTVEALQALNPGLSSNSLTIGQRIRVR
jgi:Tfp pilus assembly protein FimV